MCDLLLVWLLDRVMMYNWFVRNKNSATSVAVVICDISSYISSVTDKPVHLVLTGGFGFRQRPGYEVASKGE